MSEKTRRVTTKVDVREVDSDDVSSASNESDIKEYVKNVIDTIDSPEALTDICDYAIYQKDKAKRQNTESSSITLQRTDITDRLTRMDVLLKIINGVLTSVDQDEIDTIHKFVIDKNVIEDERVLAYMDDIGYKTAFSNGARKTDFYWSRRDKMNNYCLQFLKYLVSWGTENQFIFERILRAENHKKNTKYIVAPV